MKDDLINGNKVLQELKKIE